MNERIRLSSVLTNYFMCYAPFIGLALVVIGILLSDLIMLAIVIPTTILLSILSFFVFEVEIDMDYLYLKRWKRSTNVNLLDVVKIGQYNLGIGLAVTEVKFMAKGKTKVGLILSSPGTLFFNEIDNVDEIILKRKLDKIRRIKKNSI